MMRFGIATFAVGLWVFLEASGPLLADNNEPSDFQQVYNLIREHAAGVSEAELNRAAVKGLVSQLAPRVALVTDDAPNGTSDAVDLVLKSNVYEGQIGYLRIGRVEQGLSKAVADAYEKLGATNKLKGVVLDLRYAGGDNYEAAADTADLFISRKRPLIKLDSGVLQSRDKNDAIKLPVAVLVNHQTSKAAEALAAMVRETGTGLVLGNKTAGEAMIAQEFPLKAGERLRITTAPLELGDGTRMSSDGVQPDITVDVKPEDERAYYADAFKVIGRTGTVAGVGLSLTNQPGGTNRAARRPRFNEAELVRERREGINLDADGSAVNARTNEPELPVVHDPALARALDLLKGLAVVRQSRS
jgi:hypothetical protein